jgi:hypothetical protein
MNPWDITGWVVALAVALGGGLAVLALAALIVVTVVREIVSPGARVQRAKSKRIDVS